MGLAAEKPRPLIIRTLGLDAVLLAAIRSEQERRHAISVSETIRLLIWEAISARAPKAQMREAAD